MLRSVNIGVDRLLRIGLKVGESSKVHDRIDVSQELGGVVLRQTAERLGNLAFDHRNFVADELAQPDPEFVAKWPQRRRAVDNVIKAGRGTLVLLASNQQDQLADLGQPVEQHAEPNLAEKSRRTGD